MKFWKTRTVQKRKTYAWRIGPLAFWVRKAGEDEWYVAFERSFSEHQLVIARNMEKPESVPWNRYVFADDSDTIRFTPALPDRPVVVDSELSLRILPGNNALFYVSVPMWVRIHVGRGGEVLLCEIPTELLSNSWLGEPTGGELCYSLRTHAHRTITDYIDSPNRIYCPVRIVNDAQTALQFRKLCIHVENLRVYLGKRHVLSNQVDITYVGETTPSQVVFSPEKPSIDAECELITEERVPASKSILKKSYSFLKYFANI